MRTKSLCCALTFACATMIATSSARADTPPTSYGPYPPAAAYAPAPYPAAETVSPDADDSDGPSGLLIGGISSLATLHIAATISGFAAAGDYNNTGYAAIPVAGPFIAAALVESKSDWWDFTGIMKACFIVNGIGQAASATLVLLGLSGVGDDDDEDTSSASVAVTPSAPGAELGVGFSGAF